MKRIFVRVRGRPILDERLLGPMAVCFGSRPCRTCARRSITTTLVTGKVGGLNIDEGLIRSEKLFYSHKEYYDYCVAVSNRSRMQDYVARIRRNVQVCPGVSSPRMEERFSRS